MNNRNRLTLGSTFLLASLLFISCGNQRIVAGDHAPVNAVGSAAANGNNTSETQAAPIGTRAEDAGIRSTGQATTQRPDIK